MPRRKPFSHQLEVERDDAGMLGKLGPLERVGEDEHVTVTREVIGEFLSRPTRGEPRERDGLPGGGILEEHRRQRQWLLGLLAIGGVTILAILYRLLLR